MKKYILIILASIVFMQCKDKENEAPSKYGSASDFLETYAPKSQKFNGDAASTITFSSSNDFRYSFQPNSFRNSKGNLVTGNVDIEVIEIASKADMIYSGIMTVSNNQLLESGGMFKITATQGNEELIVTQPYLVSMPTDEFDDQMMVFRGEETQNTEGGSAVNWVLADSTAVFPDSSQQDTSDRYYFYVNFTSWCNLDKFWNATSGAQVRLKVPTECLGYETNVYMIMEDNTVTRLFLDQTNGEYNSSNYILPIGWDIQLLVVSTKDDKLSYALVDSEIVNNHLETVNSLTEISEEDLKSLIDSF